MKKIMYALTLVMLVNGVTAQTLRVPSASTTQTVRQEFGLGNIELSYSRPNAKGRAIFGDLVPFDAVWRTGANNATTLTFSDEVIIGDKKVAPGKYGLLSIPGKTEWVVILSKQLDVTSPSAYKPEQDVVRIKVKPTSISTAAETFTIAFEHTRANAIKSSWKRSLSSISLDSSSPILIMSLRC